MNSILTPAVQSILTSSVVSPYWFPVGSACNHEHIKFVFGVATYGWKEEDFAAILTRMQVDRASASSWAKARIERKIVNNMKEMGVNVSNFTDLRNVFKRNKAPEFAAKLWKGCYGMFDSDGQWELEMEQEFLQFVGWSYKCLDDGEKKLKGCVARAISVKKCELLKALNKAGKRSHGGEISKKRKSEEINEGTKFQRRIKGEPLGNFYNLLEGDDKDKKPDYFIQKEIEEKGVAKIVDEDKINDSVVETVPTTEIAHTKKTMETDPDVDIDWKVSVFILLMKLKINC